MIRLKILLLVIFSLLLSTTGVWAQTFPYHTEPTIERIYPIDEGDVAWRKTKIYNVGLISWDKCLSEYKMTPWIYRRLDYYFQSQFAVKKSVNLKLKLVTKYLYDDGGGQLFDTWTSPVTLYESGYYQVKWPFAMPYNGKFTVAISLLKSSGVILQTLTIPGECLVANYCD